MGKGLNYFHTDFFFFFCKNYLKIKEEKNRLTNKSNYVKHCSTVLDDKKK